MQFTDKLEKNPKQTFTIVTNIAWKELEAGKEKALDKRAQEVEIEGFRKGKAPLKLVREKLGEQKLLEDATREVLTAVYIELLKKHNLRPYIDPKITILKAPVNGEWEVRFEIATSPLLTKKPDYKKLALDLKGELKKADIWVPGKDKASPDKATEGEEQEKRKQEKLQKLFNELVESSEVEISPLIMDEEISRRLVGLYDEIKKLGLTVEQYLKTKNETHESLRHKLEHEIADIYKSEMVLEHIADAEKIVVEQSELDEIFKTAKDDKERENLKNNAYIYSRFIRKQKTLEFLAGL